MKDDILYPLVRERYQLVISQIRKATARSGRNPENVHLVVVTKSHPLEAVKAVIAAGASMIGENYAEEAEAKIAALTDTTVEWHMIGHVQSRKAGLVARSFSLLHSLDSVKLARRLARYCEESGKTLPVLLEVNVSGEESKYGLPAWDEMHWASLEPIIQPILGYPGLHVQGLMTMPPFDVDPEKTRPYFQKMHRLQEYLRRLFPRGNWSELSMGTSVDFVAAVEEGATYVRVGQAILGPRPG